MSEAKCVLPFSLENRGGAFEGEEGFEMGFFAVGF
jgi:hypothetical protein